MDAPTEETKKLSAGEPGVWTQLHAFHQAADRASPKSIAGFAKFNAILDKATEPKTTQVTSSEETKISQVVSLGETPPVYLLERTIEQKDIPVYSLEKADKGDLVVVKTIVIPPPSSDLAMDGKQYENMKDFTAGMLASIVLGDSFYPMCRKLLRAFDQQDQTKFKRRHYNVENKAVFRYQELLTPYLGPRPGDGDEAFGFGYMITCGQEYKNGKKISPRPGFEYILDADEHIFASIDWDDLGLDQYLGKVKLNETPDTFNKNLISWLNQMYNDHVYEYKLTPRQHADKKLLIVASFVSRRYSEYKFTIEKLINELFYVI